MTYTPQYDEDVYSQLKYRQILYLLFKLGLPIATQKCIEVDQLQDHFEQMVEDYNSTMHDRLCGCMDGLHKEYDRRGGC